MIEEPLTVKRVDSMPTRVAIRVGEIQCAWRLARMDVVGASRLPVGMSRG